MELGKSFLSVHLAVWLADAGHKVALLDADDQKTASKWLSGVAEHAVEVTVLEGGSEEAKAENLRKFINERKDSFDFVVVDTKGAAGLSTSAAVIKSDVACIPLQPSAAISGRLKMHCRQFDFHRKPEADNQKRFCFESD